MTPEESALIEQMYKSIGSRLGTMERIILDQAERIKRLEHEAHITRERLLLMDVKNLSHEIYEEGVNKGGIH